MMGPSRAAIEAACLDLATRDEYLAKAFEEVGTPEWRLVPNRFDSLARIVVYQLISIQAAAAIWTRLITHFGADVTPEAVAVSSADALRECGLSGPKVSHLKAIADACLQGNLVLDEIVRLPVEEARRNLLAIQGIGRWTADTYLMTALGQMDVFPASDVGLQESYRRLSGQVKRPDSRTLAERSRSWTPYRSVAAHLLYSWLHLDRARSASRAP